MMALISAAAFSVKFTMFRVVLLGVECTGRSTLCQFGLPVRAKDSRHLTGWPIRAMPRPSLPPQRQTGQTVGPAPDLDDAQQICPAGVRRGARDRDNPVIPPDQLPLEQAAHA